MSMRLHGIRVLVVEDNFYTRLGAVAFLRAQTDIDTVVEAADGDRALVLFAELQPDVVVVVDLRMPGMDGLELITSLRARWPNPRILVLTHYQGDEDIAQALKAGARGYLTKEASGDELLAAIRAVHGGGSFLPPPIAARLTEREREAPLTRRERQVLEQVAEGASNQEIGRTLGITTRTVEVYVSSILTKFGARSRTEAVAIGVRRGVVSSSAR